MRLDHLLSTENSGHCLVAGVGRVRDVPGPCPAGVEKIKDDNFTMHQWCGHAFGLPDRHPDLWSVRFDAFR